MELILLIVKLILMIWLHVQLTTAVRNAVATGADLEHLALLIISVGAVLLNQKDLDN